MPLPNDTRLFSRLGRTLECAVVLAVVFAPLVYRSTIYAIWLWRHPELAAGAAVFSEDALLELVRSEVLTILAVVWFLWMCGWTRADARLRVSLAGTFMGVGLALAANFVSEAPLAAWQWALPESYAAAASVLPRQAGLSAPVILASSAVNGFFEELFLCGYLIGPVAAFRQRAVWAGVSMLLRLSYHTYQGPAGLLGILLLGGLWTLYFLLKRRLWPVIVAHICLDIAGLWALAS